MSDSNWAFASLGFGPAASEFKDARVRYFVPRDVEVEDVLAPIEKSDYVLETTDLEFFLRFSEPVRKYDQIIIEFPGDSSMKSFFGISGLTNTAVWSEFGGEAPYKTEYLEELETWSMNKFRGQYAKAEYTYNKYPQPTTVEGYQLDYKV